MCELTTALYVEQTMNNRIVFLFYAGIVLSIWIAVLDLTQDFWKSSVDPHQPIMLSTNSHTKQLSSGGADAEQTILEKGGMQLRAHRAEHKISYQAAEFE